MICFASFIFLRRTTSNLKPEKIIAKNFGCDYGVNFFATYRVVLLCIPALRKGISWISFHGIVRPSCQMVLCDSHLGKLLQIKVRSGLTKWQCTKFRFYVFYLICKALNPSRLLRQFFIRVLKHL